MVDGAGGDLGGRQQPAITTEASARRPGAAARADFPALSRTVHERPLVYLDSAASTQLPTPVIDAVAALGRAGRGNVHRGVHALGEESTRAYEAARERVRAFLNARHADEVVFVRGATEGINLVAHSLGLLRVGFGDEIVVTALEHHSNIVPWQRLCELRGARLRVVPVSDQGELVDPEAVLGPRTRLVAVAHVANAIGTVNPVAAIVERAHAQGALVLVDGAQAAAHLPLDVQALGCDFYVFSGHKCYGPTGIGVLHGRRELLAAMPPYQGGGEMVRAVSFDGTSYADPPARFEAGTPALEGAVGLAAALDYLDSFDRAALAAHEQALLAHAVERLGALPGVRLVGQPARRAAVLAFVVAGVHAHDVGTILDSQGVAIRTGHHCAQPLHARFGLAASARASVALYNTIDDVDRLVDGLGEVRRLLGGDR
jgi:cysteine desulfurase/selenocysteine lyase